MKRFEGYHEDHDLPIRRGDTVTILKGTTIQTTMPSKDRTGRTGYYVTKTAGRTYKVKVDHILNGMTFTEEFVRNRGNGEKPGHKQNPSVRWPGTGGYWFSVDINDIPEAQNGS